MGGRSIEGAAEMSVGSLRGLTRKTTMAPHPCPTTCPTHAVHYSPPAPSASYRRDPFPNIPTGYSASRGLPTTGGGLWGGLMGSLWPRQLDLVRCSIRTSDINTTR